MSLPIITADQRLAERRGVKGVLVGKSGIGKPSKGARKIVHISALLQVMIYRTNFLMLS